MNVNFDTQNLIFARRHAAKTGVWSFTVTFVHHHWEYSPHKCFCPDLYRFASFEFSGSLKAAKAAAKAFALAHPHCTEPSPSTSTHRYITISFN